LIEFINKNYRGGMSRSEAIFEGIHVRLRPIFLTTLTTSLGLFPMAIGFPNYSVIWGTMASTFVTGLLAATALTLIIIPVFWDLTQELQDWYERERKAVRKAKAKRIYQQFKQENRIRKGDIRGIRPRSKTAKKAVSG
jgi:HAE1 family hydrophobic/amphiphilic exporter-1